MFEKYEGFIQWYLIRHGWSDRPFTVSIVDNHLVLTIGEGFSAVITFFDLETLNSNLYLYQEKEPEPIRKVTTIVNRKYQLDDVE